MELGAVAGSGGGGGGGDRKVANISDIISTPSGHMRTAAHSAAKSGSSACIFMLAQGFTRRHLVLPDARGRTPFHIAAARSSPPPAPARSALFARAPVSLWMPLEDGVS